MSSPRRFEFGHHSVHGFHGRSCLTSRAAFPSRPVLKVSEGSQHANVLGRVPFVGEGNALRYSADVRLPFNQVLLRSSDGSTFLCTQRTRRTLQGKGQRRTRCSTRYRLDNASIDFRFSGEAGVWGRSPHERG